MCKKYLTGNVKKFLRDGDVSEGNRCLISHGMRIPNVRLILLKFTKLSQPVRGLI